MKFAYPLFHWTIFMVWLPFFICWSLLFFFRVCVVVCGDVCGVVRGVVCGVV